MAVTVMDYLKGNLIRKVSRLSRRRKTGEQERTEPLISVEKASMCNGNVIFEFNQLVRLPCLVGVL